MPKICNADNCSYNVFGGGYCRSHQYLRERKPIEKKDRGLFVRETPVDNSKEDKKILDAWFLNKMKTSIRRCENCGENLFNLSDKDWKGSQHHILEKSIFLSVKTHPLNHLVLGRWCCHPQWHTSMLNASKMRVFPLANEKVIKMIPLLNNKELSKLSKYYIIPF